MPGIDCFGWSEIDDLCRRLARRIDQPFDTIVCVLRGGAVPGVVLANEFGIDQVVGIKAVQGGQVSGVATGAGGASYAAEAAVVSVPMNDVDLSGARVLVVDDVLDSGETLRLVKDQVRQRGARVVKIATLHVKTYSQLRPDYCVEELTNWVFYPWMSQRELGEMRARLAARSRAEAAGAAQAAGPAAGSR